LESDKLVTLAAFDNSIDAHLLRTKLESVNIAAFIFDENLVTLNPLWNLSSGGIKVKVVEADLLYAQNVMESVSKNPLRNEDNTILACPKCKSSEIANGVKAVPSRNFFSWLWVFLGIYPPNLQTKLYCNQCKTIFRRDEATVPHVGE
jgi:hypothetical protein